jgi:hypothetical protein
VDNATDVVYVDLTNCNKRIQYFLTCLGALKGLRIEIVELGRRRFPAIRYKGVTVSGLPACTEYLLWARHYPELLPATPEKAALIRDLVGQLMLYLNDLPELAPIYVERRTKTLQTLNLLDIAVAACGSPKLPKNLAWVNDIARQVDRLVDEVEHRNHENEVEDVPAT